MTRPLTPITRSGLAAGLLLAVLGLALVVLGSFRGAGAGDNRQAGLPTFVPVTPAPPVGPQGVVAASSLNMRSGPGASFRRVNYLMEGATVRLTGRNASATWAEVELPNRTRGWVNARYLRSAVPIWSLPPVVVTVDAEAMVTGELLYLYPGPSLSYPALALTQPGDVFDLHGRNERATWVYVTVVGGLSRARGLSGWVRADGPFVASASLRDLPILYPFVLSPAFSVVRAGPGAQYPVVTELRPSDTLTVVEVTDSGWAFVRLSDGRDGWVEWVETGFALPAGGPLLPESLPPATSPSSATTTPDAPSATATPIPTQTPTPEATATVAATKPVPRPPVTATIPAGSSVVAYVYLYPAPDASAEPLQALNPGQSVTLLGKTADGLWLKARARGGPEGWLAAETLEGAADLGELPVVEP